MTEECVGCGAIVDAIEGPVHRYMTAAPGCWERYGEVLSALSSDAALQTARLMCVDAYAAQHPGAPTPQAIQSVAVHLMNCYGYLVRGRPVGVPRFAGHKGMFVWLHPPTFRAVRTVHLMPTIGTHDALTSAARAWVESVWNAWSPHHAQIAQWYAAYAPE